GTPDRHHLRGACHGTSRPRRLREKTVAWIERLRSIQESPDFAKSEIRATKLAKTIRLSYKRDHTRGNVPPSGARQWPFPSEKSLPQDAGCGAPPTRSCDQPTSRTRIQASCAARTISI